MDTFLSGFLESLSDAARSRLLVMLVARAGEGEVARAVELAGSELNLDEVELIKDRKVIEAVKAVRTRTGLSLLDSKRLVDKFREKNGWKW